jgi:hypothetical protein
LPIHLEPPAVAGEAVDGEETAKVAMEGAKHAE